MSSMPEQSAIAPPVKRRWLCDLIAASCIPLFLILAFHSVLFSGDSISKMDLLKGIDYFQNLLANGPLIYTDDPSVALTHVPNELFCVNSAGSGNVPLWNQLSGGGRPFVAEFQTLVWSFFHSWFPSTNLYVYNLGILLKLLVAGLSTYFLSRKLKITCWSALAAAVAFMFCPRNLHWVELCNNFCFYPCLILTYLWMISKPSMLRASLSGLVTAALAYNMHPESYACMTVTAALLCFDELMSQKKSAVDSCKKIFAYCGLSAFIAFLVAAPLLLPFVEFIANSRSYKFDAHAPAFAKVWDYIANLTLPLGDIRFYCGPVLGLILLLGVVSCWKRHRMLVSLFVLNLLFCLRPLFFESIFESKPFSFMLPEYPLAMCILFQSILGAAGLDELFQATLSRRTRILTVMSVASTAFIVFLGQVKMFRELWCRVSDAAFDASNLDGLVVTVSAILILISVCILFKPVAEKWKAIAALLLALGNSCLMFLVVPSELHAREKLSYRPSAILNFLAAHGDRMVATGCEIFQPETNMVYGIDDFRSLAPIHPQRYQHYVEAAGIKNKISFIQECPTTLNRLIDLASVKYVLSDRCLDEADASLEKSLTLPALCPSLKLAEGLRLDKATVSYDANSLQVKSVLDFSIRGDFSNRFYCRLALADESGKIVAENVWPYQSIEQAGKVDEAHLYKWKSSLFIPALVKPFSKLSLLVFVLDRWNNTMIESPPEYKEAGGLKLADFITGQDAGAGRFQRVMDDGRFVLFENKNAMPRAYLVWNWQTVKTAEQSLAALGNSNIDWTHSAVIEDANSNSVTAKAAIESASSKATDISHVGDFARVLLRDADSSVVFCKLSSPALLICTDTFFPGWNAYVDGSKAAIMPANHAFRAVYLPAGKHVVDFIFEPKSFAVGLNLMWVGLLLSLLASVFSIYRSLRAQPKPSSDEQSP